MAILEARNAGEWKVRIDRPICSSRLDFWVYRPEANGTIIAQPEGAVLVADGQSTEGLKPTFSLSGFDGMQMMCALAEALSAEGIKTPDAHRLGGILEAQSAHLQDMRTILKLNNPSGETK